MILWSLIKVYKHYKNLERKFKPKGNVKKNIINRFYSLVRLWRVVREIYLKKMYAHCVSSSSGAVRCSTIRIYNNIYSIDAYSNGWQISERHTFGGLIFCWAFRNHRNERCLHIVLVLSDYCQNIIAVISFKSFYPKWFYF